VLGQIQATDRTRNRYRYLGYAVDTLFDPKYHHKHHDGTCKQCTASPESIYSEAMRSSFKTLGCDKKRLVAHPHPQAEPAEGYREGGYMPGIHFGSIASGDKIMKSAEDRDRIAKETGVLSLKMEGAGIWDEVP
jgi:nucleoside phosphorylase